jgi:hypothetical protein
MASPLPPVLKRCPSEGTGRAVAPVRGELKPMMMIHDLGQRLGVGLIPDVPGGDARQRRERNSRTRIGHPGEAQIDTIGQDGGEQGSECSRSKQDDALCSTLIASQEAGDAGDQDRA